jgi:crooked neck
LKLIPHRKFTFAKLWLLAAKLELRQHRLEAARKILGMSLGLAPKDKVFKEYIEIERIMGKIDRWVTALTWVLELWLCSL